LPQLRPPQAPVDGIPAASYYVLYADEGHGLARAEHAHL